MTSRSLVSSWLRANKVCKTSRTSINLKSSAALSSTTRWISGSPSSSATWWVVTLQILSPTWRTSTMTITFTGLAKTILLQRKRQCYTIAALYAKNLWLHALWETESDWLCGKARQVSLSAKAFAVKSFAEAPPSEGSLTANAYGELPPSPFQRGERSKRS
jgi:hypothetical protein